MPCFDRTRKGLLPLLLAWTWGALPNFASAQLPPQVTIRWRATADCARPATLEADVARRLGSEAIDPDATTIDVVVARHAIEPYEVTLSIAGSDAERRVQLNSCAEVERAATLLIATALAPAHQLQAEASEPSEAGAMPALRWSLRAGALFDLRSLPGASGGPALGVELARARLRGFGEARYLVPRTFRDAGSDTRAGVDLWGFALGSAYLWSLGSFAFGPCLDAEFGVQRAKARGSRAAGSTYGPWIAGWLGLRSEYTGFRALALTLTALLGTPILRSEFALTDPLDPYQSTGLSFRLQAGLRFALDAKNPDERGQ